MAAKKRRNKRNTKSHLHVAYTTQILNAFMNPTPVTLKSKITTYIAQEHGFSTTPTDQSGHSKIKMIMIITYTVCDIEKAVNPRNIYGMSLCCQKKANGNIISAMQKDLNSNKNWARTGPVHDRAVRLIYSAFVAKFVAVFR